MKTKKELVIEAAELGRKHLQKKEVIEKILNDLDKEEKVSQKHLDGIAAVNELMKELNELEVQHEEIKKQIIG